jgi:hypothetical protein
VVHQHVTGFLDFVLQPDLAKSSTDLWPLLEQHEEIEGKKNLYTEAIYFWAKIFGGGCRWYNGFFS